MPNQQSVLFTVMPRGVTLDGATRPVSVFVTPRLTGDSTLGSFSDWRHWTTRLHDYGLAINLVSGAASQTVQVDTSALQPALWEALFADDTLVNPYTFDDYSDRGIISYPVRRALSALKALYQNASVTLAIPQGGVSEDGQSVLRRELTDMIQGLPIHWSPALGEELREQVRITGIPGLFAPGWARTLRCSTTRGLSPRTLPQPRTAPLPSPLRCSTTCPRRRARRHSCPTGAKPSTSIRRSRRSTPTRCCSARWAWCSTSTCRPTSSRRPVPAHPARSQSARSRRAGNGRFRPPCRALPPPTSRSPPAARRCSSPRRAP